MHSGPGVLQCQQLGKRLSAPDQPHCTSIEQHLGTDYQYADKLAKDAGYEFYVTPGPAPGTNTAYWGPQVRVGIPQPALT